LSKYYSSMADPRPRARPDLFGPNPRLSYLTRWSYELLLSSRHSQFPFLSQLIIPAGLGLWVIHISFSLTQFFRFLYNDFSSIRFSPRFILRFLPSFTSVSFSLFPLCDDRTYIKLRQSWLQISPPNPDFFPSLHLPLSPPIFIPSGCPTKSHIHCPLLVGYNCSSFRVSPHRPVSAPFFHHSRG